MSSSNETTIYKLRLLLDLITSQKNDANLSPKDLETLTFGLKYFGEEYHLTDYTTLKKKLPPSAITDLISNLEKEDSEKTTKKETRPKEDIASVPPELESLVAEYEKNKQELEEKDATPSSTAKQIQQALEHNRHKIYAQTIKDKRQSQGARYLSEDEAITKYGTPKAENAIISQKEAYSLAKDLAFQTPNFSKLSPQTQNQIITDAVELSLAGIPTAAVALQVAMLELKNDNLSSEELETLSRIPDKFIKDTYTQINLIEKQNQEIESEIIANSDKIYELQTQGNLEEANKLIEKNQDLEQHLQNQEARLINSIAKQTQSFEEYKKNREKLIAKDPSLSDREEIVSQKVASIHSNLRSTVSPHLHTPSDDIPEFEKAFRSSLPGNLLPHAGYEAQRLAALISKSGTNLSPEALLLYGKGLDENLLAEARLFAKNNPDSPLGVLFRSNKQMFDTLSSNIKKISSSPLGKELTQFAKNPNSFLRKSQLFFGKISDQLGSFSQVLNIASDPVGALKSYLGRKAGEYLLKKFSSSAAGKAAQAALKELAKKALSEGSKKAIASLATKLGVEAALASTGIGAIVAAVMIAFDIISSVIKKIGKTLYGEDVKARDLLAIPVVAAMTIGGKAGGLFQSFAAASLTAASSAIGIISLSVFLGVFFYITSIVVAPLLSTLVQLDSSTTSQGQSGYYGPILPGCPQAWPAKGRYAITQGPSGQFSHYNSGYTEGIDLGMAIGTEIYSTSYGIVEVAQLRPDYLSTNVVIVGTTLPNGTAFKIIYAHLTTMTVTAGNKVEPGTLIGYSGTAGSGAHLHYEYKGIKYNQCPAGGIQLTEGCGKNEYPGPNQTCTATATLFSN